jgi:nitrogen fixation-related uncharacterized protein
MAKSNTSISSDQFQAFIGIVVVVLLIAGGWFFWSMQSGKSNDTSVDGAYQAVFLSNGQVYFGMITDRSRDGVVLEDVYYLRTQQELQAPTEDEEARKPQVTLVKLGDEIHAPLDRMTINREHVLYIETLKDDGQVVRAIAQNKSKG